MKDIIGYICFLALFSLGSALECYYCNGQDTNRWDCTNKDHVRRCEIFQDTCTSYIRWSTPNYQTYRDERAYYISKGCDTSDGCSRRQALYSMSCTRDWYHDWACVECCKGDLCNYDVTLGAGSIKASVFAVLSATAVWIFLH